MKTINTITVAVIPYVALPWRRTRRGRRDGWLRGAGAGGGGGGGGYKSGVRRREIATNMVVKRWKMTRNRTEEEEGGRNIDEQKKVGKKYCCGDEKWIGIELKRKKLVSNMVEDVESDMK